MNSLSVGIIGIGNMGKNHARVCKSLDSIVLIGVHDANPQAKLFAEEMAVPFFEDAEQLIKQSDALILALPTHLHVEWAQKCLEQGKHVLVEKPMADTYANAERLVRAAHKSSSILQVGHIERFNPAVQELKKIIEKEDIEIFEAKRMGPLFIRESMSGVILDLMIHDVDVLRYLTGKEPRVLFATKKKLAAYENQNEDYALATLDFGNSIAALEANRVCQKKIRTLTAFSHSSYIEMDYLSQDISIYQKKEATTQNDRSYTREYLIEKPLVPKSETLKNELASFAAACLDQHPCECTAEDALQSMRVVFNILEQCRV